MGLADLPLRATCAASCRTARPSSTCRSPQRQREPVRPVGRVVADIAAAVAEAARA